MKKEVTYTEKYCDGCNKKEELIAVSGHSRGGWGVILYKEESNENYLSFDLCDSCYSKYMAKVLDTINDKDRIKIMEVLKEETHSTQPTYPSGFIPMGGY